MGILGNLIKKNETLPGKSPVLKLLTEYVKNNSVNNAIPLLASKGQKNNPVSIPYTPEAISNDFMAIRLCMQENAISDNELAALVATKLMKKHPSSIKDLLLQSGYTMPDKDRIIYLNTYTSSILTLREFISIGAKQYQVVGCGDQRMCLKCSKQNGKKHLVSKAVIGKTAPPFCEKCRCIITAEF